MRYFEIFLMVCGVAGVIDVFFCKGKIGVVLSEWLYGLFK